MLKEKRGEKKNTIEVTFSMGKEHTEQVNVLATSSTVVC
jgi:hypothetical protein